MPPYQVNVPTSREERLFDELNVVDDRININDVPQIHPFAPVHVSRAARSFHDAYREMTHEDAYILPQGFGLTRSRNDTPIVPMMSPLNADFDGDDDMPFPSSQIENLERDLESLAMHFARVNQIEEMRQLRESSIRPPYSTYPNDNQSTQHTQPARFPQIASNDSNIPQPPTRVNERAHNAIEIEHAQMRLRRSSAYDLTHLVGISTHNIPVPPTESVELLRTYGYVDIPAYSLTDPVGISRRESNTLVQVAARVFRTSQHNTIVNVNNSIQTLQVDRPSGVVLLRGRFNSLFGNIPFTSQQNEMDAIRTSHRERRRMRRHNNIVPDIMTSRYHHQSRNNQPTRSTRK